SILIDHAAGDRPFFGSKHNGTDGQGFAVQGNLALDRSGGRTGFPAASRKKQGEETGNNPKQVAHHGGVVLWWWKVGKKSRPQPPPPRGWRRPARGFEKVSWSSPLPGPG